MQLLCVGDLALTRKLSINKPWRNPVENFEEADKRILVNWEFPIGTQVNPKARTSGSRFIANTQSPQVIQSWSPGFASLATNHMLDAGPEGVGFTIDALQNIGFETFGAGRTLEEIQRPLVWQTKQGKLTIVNWVFAETHPDSGNLVPGVNCWPGEAQAAELAGKLRGQTDWLMALLHWSDEFFPYPRLEDRKTAQALADMGFDLIVAHHPHVVRGMEKIGTVPVYYSLGNFFFSDSYSDKTKRREYLAPRNREGLGLKITFVRGRKPVCEPLSFWQEKDQIDYDNKRRAEKRLIAGSRPLTKMKADSSYEAWYQKERSRFKLWGERWHFVVRRLGLRGMLRYMIYRLTSNTS